MKRFIAIALLLTSLAGVATAQENNDSTAAEQAPGLTILPPLFDYPVAPDEIEGWKERNNWLVQHFWDNFDFKQKAVGQAQLQHAVKTFIVPLRFADLSVSMKAVDTLIGKLKKNPGLLLQFTMAAERNIYDPMTADAIIDDVYLPFLKAVSADKKLPAIRKVRYQAQLKALDGCCIGDPMKSFDFVNRNGGKQKFTPTGGKYALIEFGDPDCTECRIMRISLNTDPVIKKAAEEGRLDIYFMVPDVEDDSWIEMVKDYPETWTVGAGSSLEENLDLRYTPCIYLLGPEKNIMLKNATLEEVKNALQGE